MEFRDKISCIILYCIIHVLIFITSCKALHYVLIYLFYCQWFAQWGNIFEYFESVCRKNFVYFYEIFITARSLQGLFNKKQTWTQLFFHKFIELRALTNWFCVEILKWIKALLTDLLYGSLLLNSALFSHSLVIFHRWLFYLSISIGDLLVNKFTIYFYFLLDLVLKEIIFSLFWNLDRVFVTQIIYISFVKFIELLL